MISGQQLTSKLTGGYEAKLIDDIQKRHECPVCLLPMRSPYQTECGHLFCKSCLEPLFRRRNPLCPIDQEVITREGVSCLDGVKSIFDGLIDFLRIRLPHVFFCAHVVLVVSPAYMINMNSFC